MDHRRNTHMMHQFSPILPPPFLPDPPFLPEAMNCSLPPSIHVDQSLSNLFSLLNLSPPPYSDVTRRRQIGSSVAVGEGFVHHSDFGLNTLNPHHHHHYHQWCSSNNASEVIEQMFVPINNKLTFQRSESESDDDDDKRFCYNSNQLCGVSLSRFQNQNHQFLSSCSLKELRGRIYALAKDQNGCKLLQSMFERPTMEDVQMVLSEVVDSICDLMKDQFGNYLVQKLVVLCNNDQKLQILVSLIKVPTNIILVCMNPHGTRSVQKLLENLKDPNQVKLVMRALHHGAAALANDPNGHHVIQYCLVNFHSDLNKPILTEIADSCFKVATDRSGCCVLQACVEHSRGEVRMRLVAEIMANSVHLAEDPFGNYVLQHMLGLHIPEFTLLLVRQLQGSFASLSCNKYCSNVVEKCLKESGEGVSTRIILEIISSPNSYLLLVDPYANFVIQSALKVSKGFAHECLCGLISKHMPSMRSNLYGKKILERFEKRRS